MRDRNLRGREAKGDRNGKSKLTEEGVREIKRQLQLGATYNELAQQHGVHPATICGVATGRAWRHIDPGCVIPRKRKLRSNVIIDLLKTATCPQSPESIREQLSSKGIHVELKNLAAQMKSMSIDPEYFIEETSHGFYQYQEKTRGPTRWKK